MRPILLTLALAGACLAQQWEIGAGAGVALYKNATVTRGGEKADAGFDTGPAFTAFGAQNLYEHIGGEIRYTVQLSDLLVERGGTKATASAQSHAIGYNLLFYFTERDAAVRPYVLAGGGGKIYRGRAKESEIAPPNAEFAILSRTTQIKGMGTFGGGVRARVAENVFLRFDVRDDLTPIPKEVIAPVPGATASGWIHSITPTVSLSFGF